MQQLVDEEMKAKVLLYSSCVAAQLQDYLRAIPWVDERFEIEAVLIHVMELSELLDLRDFVDRKKFEEADYVFTNCFSPRWADLGLHRVNEIRKSSSQLFTWVPPNFSAFWPVVDAHGEHGVVAMLKQGMTSEEIIRAFDERRFEPDFARRWVEQMGRLWEREKDCDIKVAGFCERHQTEIKLWFTDNHPTYNIIAWLGSQIVAKLGGEPETEESCVARDHAANGTWNAWPETHYEFGHFQFKYPMRYATTPHWGGPEFYHGLITKIADRFRSGN